MKDILEKISSYNLFNYFLPGLLFVLITGKVTDYAFNQDDIIFNVILYYFIGLIISRIGSLFLEPFLIKIKYLKFAPYKDFIKANDLDSKIELLSEANNMYRTICSMFLSIILLKIYTIFHEMIPFLKQYDFYILVFFLLILFILSYKKQTDYIKKRVEILKDAPK